MYSSRRMLVFLLFLGSMVALGSSCPTVCACKWKGGKQTVECCDRGLITIPENVDPETQVLDMSGNNLQILPRETFIRANLRNLQKVYLKSCRLGQIDDIAFRGLTNLVELDLSSNLLTFIPTATFADVPLLRELIISNNPIQKIESHAFKYLPGLVKLDLSSCELKTIAPKAFENLELLELLKLNDNRLNELRQKTVETLRRLHGVELHDNPWQCDCRLRPVKAWLEENNIPYPVEPVCGGPERIAARSFSDLHIDDFACKPEVLPVSRHVEATTGDNASIVCRVGAIPPATISWFWNGRLLTNNSLFSMGAQRVVMYEDGHFEKSSSLVLTNAQETDSSEFYCIAENRAGTAEANFTLHVAMRTAGMASLGSGQIAGLSAALVILILFILLLILILLIRLRRLPFSSSTKTPTPHEPAKVVTSNTVTIETERRNGTATHHHVDGISVKPPVMISIPDTKLANQVQKPPRLTDISYSTSHYDGSGSVIDTSCYNNTSTRGTPNNPDLINEAERVQKPDEPNRIIINKLNNESIDENGMIIPNSEVIIQRSASGEYSRAHGDSLYPSALWESPNSSPGQVNSSVADLFLRRTTSTGFEPNDTSDKTPIIEGDEDNYNCRTLPINRGGHPSPWSTDPGDYPPDYGLPIPSEHSPPAPAPGQATTPPGAKTLRVWQRGAVPVLPPVTALKRVLGSRNSPDEGYQEGCGTDV